MKKIQTILGICVSLIVIIATVCNFIAFFNINDPIDFFLFILFETILVVIFYIVEEQVIMLPNNLEKLGYRQIPQDVYEMLTDSSIGLLEKNEKYTNIGKFELKPLN